MKKKLSHVLFFLGALILTRATFADDMALQMLWQVDGLSNPESVVYDENNRTLYVSNINGESSAKDNNGFISKVSLQGEVIELHWVTGLNAPKGLAIQGGYLYVADIDELVEIDIAGASISNRYPDTDARFFNDVAAADDGVIYVSDSMTNTIYQLKNGKFSRWLNSAALRSPNGLLAEAGSLLVTAWGTGEGSGAIPGQVLAVSMQDKSISIIGNQHTQGNLDGIEANSNGDYYITEWMLGKLLLMKKSGEVHTLLTLEMGMADLEYIEAKGMLILPMLKTDKLIAYKLPRD